MDLVDTVNRTTTCAAYQLVDTLVIAEDDHEPLEQQQQWGDNGQVGNPPLQPWCSVVWAPCSLQLQQR